MQYIVLDNAAMIEPLLENTTPQYELSTNELLIVSLYETGHSPSAIALKLGIGANDVRALLRSSKAIAYKMEQEECTDELIRCLYRDGANALRDCLNSTNPNIRLKAAEMVMKLLNKLKGPEVASSQTSIRQVIQQAITVIQSPISQQELQEVSKYYDSSRANSLKAAVRAPALDCQQG
jgi:DNA-binding CsgD family transcriptional regulator